MGDFLSALGYLALGSRLRRLSDDLMGDAARFYKLHGVSFSPKWFGLFRLLIEQPNLSIGEAATQLGLTHPAISQMAKELTKDGLLSSKTDVKDERRRTIELTRKGKDLAAKMEPIWSAIEEASRELSEDAGLDIIAKLEKLEQAMRERPMFDRLQARYLSRGLKLADMDSKTKDKFRTLNLAWLEKNFTLEPIDEQVLKNPEQEIIAKGGSVIMAMMESETVGAVAVKPLTEGRWELLKLAVDPKHRGRGIGERLAREAITRAKKRGARTVYLETSRVLEPAVRLYKKLGFKEVERPAQTETQRCDLCMEIRLAK
ncbi:MAG: bifunctional helix-turn-helix transcriptional regulator/GNAT family N-acetyltransferase [Phycisphaerales bacterium]|nr:bifunctional helix-turn-helix transcriptional regulator/GNAT family N-acetyltransferase [Phycisphaerales bacterium]